MKRTIWTLGILLIIALLIAVGLYGRRWLAIDACLDRGGTWNYQENTCAPFTARETCESGGGRWTHTTNTCERK
jgi:hypothetical protein